MSRTIEEPIPTHSRSRSKISQHPNDLKQKGVSRTPRRNMEAGFAHSRTYRGIFGNEERLLPPPEDGDGRLEAVILL